jgi:hypothetical protein
MTISSYVRTFQVMLYDVNERRWRVHGMARARQTLCMFLDERRIYIESTTTMMIDDLNRYYRADFFSFCFAFSFPT